MCFLKNSAGGRVSPAALSVARVCQEEAIGMWNALRLIPHGSSTFPYYYHLFLILELFSGHRSHQPGRTMEMEVVVAAQSSSVREMGNIKGRGLCQGRGTFSRICP